VQHAVRHKYACTAVDVLARRLGVAFEDAHSAECMLPRVADIMALELGWSSSQRECQLREATRFLEEQMGLALCRPHRHAPVLQLDSNEFARLVRLFEFLDKTQVRVLSPVVSRLLSRHRRVHVYRYARAQARGGFTERRDGEAENWFRSATGSDDRHAAGLRNANVAVPLLAGVDFVVDRPGLGTTRHRVEALSKTSELTRDSLATILDEMEDATSGGMELGDFLLFMNNLKICQRAQQKRRHHKDATQDILAKLHIQNVDPAELRIQNVDTPFSSPPAANSA
ncbi:hypothetical protein HPB47_027979, partial [Ixodes persulcatus]